MSDPTDYPGIKLDEETELLILRMELRQLKMLLKESEQVAEERPLIQAPPTPCQGTGDRFLGAYYEGQGPRYKHETGKRWIA